MRCTARTARATGLLLRKAAGSVAPDAEQAVGAAAGSTGHALPDDLRTKFEGSLGTDLSSVRVHTGAASADAASAVGAKAYATGNDVHFGAGHYDPSSSSGQELIAHEVAHTVQQRGGSPQRQHKLEVSSPGDHAEVEADRAASAMVSGGGAVVGTSSGIQREAEAAASEGEKGKDEDDFISDSVEIAKAEPRPWPIGPVKLKLGAAANLTYQTAVPGGGKGENTEGSKEEAKGPEVKVEVGKNKKGRPELKLAVEQEGKAWQSGWTPTYSGGVEYKDKKVGLKSGLSLKHSWGGDIALTYKPIELTVLEVGRKIEILSATTGVEGSAPLTDVTIAGTKLKIGVKVSGDFTVAPDFEKIGEWILEKVGEEALSAIAEVAAAAGVLAGIALGAYMCTTEGDDIGAIAGQAYNGIRDYAACYAGAMLGQPAGATTTYGPQGFARGKTDLEALKVKFPEDVVHAKARGAYTSVINAATPEFRKRAVDEWSKRHALKTKIMGEVDTTFTSVLDGVLKNASSGEVDGKPAPKMENLAAGQKLAIDQVTAAGEQIKLFRGVTSGTKVRGMGLKYPVAIQLRGEFGSGKSGKFAGASMIGAFDLQEGSADVKLNEKTPEDVCTALLSYQRVVAVLEAQEPTAEETKATDDKREKELRDQEDEDCQSSDQRRDYLPTPRQSVDNTPLA